MYAVVKTGGKQERVSAGDIVVIEKIPGDVGDSVELSEVIMLGGDGKSVLSREALAKAKVIATIVEQARDDKVLVFKYKPKKGYKRTRGHRQPITKLLIESIEDGTGKKAAKPKVEAQAKPAKAEAKPAKAQAKPAKAEAKPAKTAKTTKAGTKAEAKEAKAEAKTATKPKTAAKAKAEAKAKVEAKPKTSAKARAKTQAKPKAAAKPTAQTKPKTAAKPRAEAKPKKAPAKKKEEK